MDRSRFTGVSAKKMRDRAYKSGWCALAIIPSDEGGEVVGFMERGKTHPRKPQFPNWRDASGSVPAWAMPCEDEVEAVGV